MPAAWTTPRTWVDDEIITDTIMNTHVRDMFLFTDQHNHNDAAGQGNDELTGLDKLSFDNIGAPALAGELKRNGNFLEYFDTEVVRLGSAAAAGTPSLRQLGTGDTDASPGNHGHDTDADGTFTNVKDAGATNVPVGVSRTGPTTATSSITLTKAGRVFGAGAFLSDSGSSDGSLDIDGTQVGAATNSDDITLQGSRALSSGAKNVVMNQDDGLGSEIWLCAWAMGGVIGAAT